jgi:CDP-6-deoxy-D-xylo-4-hexulose-3-dehydrase
MQTKSWPLMHSNITRADLDLIIQYLSGEDPQLTHGPKVREFERKWSEWLGVKYSVMVNSGSSANDLTMLALKHLKGVGEVIVPPLTWVSDIASVLHAGMSPKFVDISPRNLALDETKVLNAISSNTKAVFLTHVLGYDGLTDKLIATLSDLGILLIEDVCESHGATHNGKKLGSFGWASNFSFYYAHHLTTIEGGMICTNDQELFEVIRMLRSHGMLRESTNENLKEKYMSEYPDLNSDFIFTMASHNMRPTELNGLLGISQLNRLDTNNKKRVENLDCFLDNLNSEIFRTDFLREGNSNYAFTLVLKEPSYDLRDKVEFQLKSNGVEFRRGLSGGGNQLRQPYLRNISGLPTPESLKETEHVHNFAWYIGNYPSINQSDIIWLVNLLNQI